MGKMKKFLVGAILMVGLMGCASKSNFLDDANHVNPKGLMETNLSLVDSNGDNTYVYRISTDGNAYYITYMYDGNVRVKKFVTLNNEVIEDNNCTIVEDNINAMPRQVFAIPTTATSEQSNVINNNIYVGQEQEDKEPTKAELKAKAEESVKLLRIKELEEKIESLKNN